MKSITCLPSTEFTFIMAQSNKKTITFSGNIFIHRNPKFLQSPESGLESCEDEEDEVEEAVIYKIGKFCLQIRCVIQN